MATKKQHNPRRHVFAATGTNENQNPVQSEKVGTSFSSPFTSNLLDL